MNFASEWLASLEKLYKVNIDLSLLSQTNNNSDECLIAPHNSCMNDTKRSVISLLLKHFADDAAEVALQEALCFVDDILPG